jgi:hypothetical protein
MFSAGWTNCWASATCREGNGLREEANLRQGIEFEGRSTTGRLGYALSIATIAERIGIRSADDPFGAEWRLPGHA